VPLLEIALLAIVSMFWPLLLVVVVIALRSSKPAGILVWFYVGGFITAASVGSAMVFLLQDSPLMTGSRLPSAHGVDVALGLLAFVPRMYCDASINAASADGRCGRRPRSDRAARTRCSGWLRTVDRSRSPAASSGPASQGRS
jgi:hypothetical protein